MFRYLRLLVFVWFLPIQAFSDTAVDYAQNCASCHGKNREGALASSLIDQRWLRGDSHLEIIKSIKFGIPALGMPAWKDRFSDAEIEALAHYIKSDAVAQSRDGNTHTEFTLEKVFAAEDELWSIEFIDDSSYLLTQIDGTLWYFQNGKARKIIDTPTVWRKGQGGLLSVAVHPEYQKNGWVYLSFASSADDSTLFSRDKGITKIVRGKIKQKNGDLQWAEQETIFELPSKFHGSRSVHFGSRFAFKDGYLFFGIGDRGEREHAQDLSRPNGKIFRLHDDGRVPKDNPFVAVKDAMPEIWSYGHRNPQGLRFDPVTQTLWESEHGPKGGDELNKIVKGRNYGWPVITYGRNYSGTSITDITEKEGMEQPVHYWVPSIATSNIAVYRGAMFPEWQGHILIGGLAAQTLRLLNIQDGKVIEEKELIKDKGRVRDVLVTPEGKVYVLITESSRKRGALYKLSAKGD